MSEDAREKEDINPELWQVYPLNTVEDIRQWQSRAAGLELQDQAPSFVIPDLECQMEDRPNSSPALSTTVDLVRSGTTDRTSSSPRRSRRLVDGRAIEPNPNINSTTDMNSPAKCGTENRRHIHQMEDVCRSSVSEISSHEAAADRGQPKCSILPEDFQAEFLW